MMKLGRKTETSAPLEWRAPSVDYDPDDVR